MSGSSKDRSELTSYALVAGGVLSIALHLLFPQRIMELWVLFAGAPPSRADCGAWFFCFFASLFAVLSFLDTGDALFAPVGICLVGCVSAFILRASSELDFADETDRADTQEPFRWSIWVSLVCAAFYAIAWLTILNSGQILGETGVIGVILMIPMAIALIVSPLVMLGSMALFFAAVLCLPRAWIFWRTSSKLSSAYQGGISQKAFNADSVVEALGEEANSSLQARAMRKEVKKIDDDIGPRLEKLRRENAALTASIEEDTKRKEELANVSKKMAEIEDLELKNRRLRRMARESKDER